MAHGAGAPCVLALNHLTKQIIAMRQLALATAFFFLVTASQPIATRAQSRDSINVEEASLRFAKMAWMAQRLFGEAQRSDNEYATLGMARRYVRYARGNLMELEGHIEPERYEMASSIVGVLQRMAQPGESSTPQAATARAIMETFIVDFIRSIYIKDAQEDETAERR